MFNNCVSMIPVLAFSCDHDVLLVRKELTTAASPTCGATGPTFSVFWYKIAGVVAKVSTGTAIRAPRFQCDFKDESHWTSKND
jgi:hypothetical protein